MPLAQSIGLDTLSKYFHLPINDVAKELGVCATVLKKICRKNGIPRWPHRKIKSLDKMIATLEASVAKNPEDEERIGQEIHTLKNKRTFLMKNPNVLATKPPKKTSKTQSKRASGDGFNVHSFEVSSSLTRDIRGGELNPMASALYSQLSHPSVPQPLSPHSHELTYAYSPSHTSSQWLPGDYDDHKSAFVSPKSIRLKHNMWQQQYENMADITSQYPTSPQVPATPSLSPTPDHQILPHDEPHSVPHVAPLKFPIYLPELRIPDIGEKRKLSTLEPDMFSQTSSITSTSPGNTSPSNRDTLPSMQASGNRWLLPEWFEDEHKNAMAHTDRASITSTTSDGL